MSETLRHNPAIRTIAEGETFYRSSDTARPWAPSRALRKLCPAPGVYIKLAGGIYGPFTTSTDARNAATMCRLLNKAGAVNVENWSRVHRSLAVFEDMRS